VNKMAISINWNPPSWYEDAYYKPTQDYLLPYGQDLMEGRPKEYFAPIGEVGGPMFEDLVGKYTRDITKRTEESAIKRGVGRGGAVGSAVAQNVADVSSKMRWQDFLRAMEGRKGFLDVGRGIGGLRVWRSGACAA